MIGILGEIDLSLGRSQKPFPIWRVTQRYHLDVFRRWFFTDFTVGFITQTEITIKNGRFVGWELVFPSRKSKGKVPEVHFFFGVRRCVVVMSIQWAAWIDIVSILNWMVATQVMFYCSPRSSGEMIQFHAYFSNGLVKNHQLLNDKHMSNVWSGWLSTNQFCLPLNISLVASVCETVARFLVGGPVEVWNVQRIYAFRCLRTKPGVANGDDVYESMVGFFSWFSDDPFRMGACQACFQRRNVRWNGSAILQTHITWICLRCFLLFTMANHH